jgi:hypothetical protein
MGEAMSGSGDREATARLARWVDVAAAPTNRSTCCLRVGGSAHSVTPSRTAWSTAQAALAQEAQR